MLDNTAPAPAGGLFGAPTPGVSFRFFPYHEFVCAHVINAVLMLWVTHLEAITITTRFRAVSRLGCCTDDIMEVVNTFGLFKVDPGAGTQCLFATTFRITLEVLYFR